jgi:Mrp family chromosome partitioning ATPase
MEEVILYVRDRYDFVLIDCPPILSLPDINIIERIIDKVILVVRAEKTKRDMINKAIASLDADKIAGIILNDVKVWRPGYYQPHYTVA